MNKKALKYSLAVIIVLLLAYNSVYFRKLSEVKAQANGSKINTEKYARDFWDNKLLPGLDKAIEINQLMELMHQDKEKAFEQHSHSLGIGNLKYFLIKGEAEILSVNENTITIKSSAGQQRSQNLQLETEYVFGNSVRDASGLLSMNAFDNTTEFNEVSAGINKIIRQEVIPPFKKAAATGDKIQFVGAIELNKKFLDTTQMLVTPVQLTFINKK